MPRWSCWSPDCAAAGPGTDTVAGGFVMAAALMTGILDLTGPGPAGRARRVAAGLLADGAAFPNPAAIAGLAAVAESAAPWLSRPWRRTAWATLLLVAVARLITGGLSPMELVLAVAAGVAVGAGLLVAFGVPDRRMGTAGVTAALQAGGVPASQVAVAGVTATGITALHGGDGGRAGPVCQGLRLGPA